jgi:DNA-3-methyladenine glycosylase II
MQSVARGFPLLLKMSTRATRASRRLSDRAAAASPSAPSEPVSKSKKAAPKQHKRAAEAELEESLDGRPDSELMPPPATPPAKRPRKSRKEDPNEPPTPTPERAKLMHQPASPAPAKKKAKAAAGRPVDADDIPVDRPADPNATNAPLATPGGTRHTAYSKQSPPPSYVPAPRTDTAHLLTTACEHLCKVDPRMRILIDAHPCPLFTPEALAEPVDPFRSLVSGILAQQVSGAAAASIKRKFVALFNKDIDDAAHHHFPTPKQVVGSDLVTLRTAGLSQRKAEYIYGLAEKFVAGELSTEILLKADWDEVLEKLTAVRGLGIWSVEMFGCFALKRMDIFSTGDLGVQ